MVDILENNGQQHEAAHVRGLFLHNLDDTGQGQAVTEDYCPKLSYISGIG
jgi:hypothetical protein